MNAKTRQHINIYIFFIHERYGQRLWVRSSHFNVCESSSAPRATCRITVSPDPASPLPTSVVDREPASFRVPLVPPPVSSIASRPTNRRVLELALTPPPPAVLRPPSCPDDPSDRRLLGPPPNDLCHSVNSCPILEQKLVTTPIPREQCDLLILYFQILLKAHETPPRPLETPAPRRIPCTAKSRSSSVLLLEKARI